MRLTIGRNRFAAGLLTLAAVALVLGLGSFAGRTASGGTLTGFVTSVVPDGFSLPGIPEVRVIAEPGEYTAITNSRGKFTMNLPPGVYTLTFIASGYETLTQNVIVPSDAPASMNVALYYEPEGAPIPILKWGGRAETPDVIPYNTSVYVYAADSQNIVRNGIRWEIKDENGKVVNDPYAVPARPLQLEPSPIPGSSPLEFTFTPPYPGTFTIKMFLKNSFSKGKETSAQLQIRAENVPPQVLPRLIAGPNPPSKNPDGQLKQSSGLSTVVAGDKVYLAGYAIDQNMPSPEIYNPGGRKPDAYGKNDDWLQRQFSWKWTLKYVDGSGAQTDVSNLLTNPESQYPWFVAEKSGRYVATLTVEDNDPYGGSLREKGSVSVTALPADSAVVPDKNCTQSGCHDTKANANAKALAGQRSQAAGGAMTCQGCHGPGQVHMAVKSAESKRGTMPVSYNAGVCGQCHKEYAEWEKSHHSDGYPYGFYEVAAPLLLNCVKCHYPEGFNDALNMAKEKQISFGQVEFKKPLFPGGPLFFDFGKTPEPIGKGINCLACHDPHKISPDNQAGLRADKSALCGTCHEEKWQNVLLERTAGKTGSAYEYPNENYDFPNPHNTPDKCVLCHMNDAGKTDANGVAILGGHTMRIRDAGPDGKLGGYGPSPDDPTRAREKFGADDILNTAPCQKCHPGTKTFDINQRQKEIYTLWLELGKLLKDRNKGVLPGYKPGDKCATCHRGGTLPFDKDPKLVLENAYTNYKLVMNDRSWGIHNYQYTKKLLEDSIRSVKEYKGK